MRVEARRFYTKAVDRVHGTNRGGLGWHEEHFDEVDWEALSIALKHKPEGLQLWLSKQIDWGLHHAEKHSNDSRHP